MKKKNKEYEKIEKTREGKKVKETIKQGKYVKYSGIINTNEKCKIKLKKKL